MDGEKKRKIEEERANKERGKINGLRGGKELKRERGKIDEQRERKEKKDLNLKEIERR